MNAVLIVDDDLDVLHAAKLLLKPHFETVSMADTPQAIPGVLAKTPCDAVLLDMNYGPQERDGSTGLSWVDRIGADAPGPAVVCMTAYGEIDVAVEAMRRGAADYLIKPWEPDKLIAAVRAAAELGRARQDSARWRRQALSSANPSAGVVRGESAAMRAVWDTVARAGPTDAAVLITGPNGSGKSVAARAVHEASNRAHGPFVTIDVSALPDEAAEADLFGHVRGAFDGAHADRAGRLAAAEHGTVFLKGVTSANEALQRRLVQLMTEGSLTPLGAHTPQPLDVRIVAAATGEAQDVATVLAPELHYALSTIVVRVPGLGERRDDIPGLVSAFVDRFAAKHGRAELSASDAALAALSALPWPGHVRQLEHACERAVILGRGPELLAGDFDDEAEAVTPDGAGPGTLEGLERAALARAIRDADGNLSQAAKTLGLSRPALYRRIEKYGL